MASCPEEAVLSLHPCHQRVVISKNFILLLRAWFCRYSVVGGQVP